MLTRPDWQHHDTHWWVVDQTFRIVDASFGDPPFPIEQLLGLSDADLNRLVLAHFASRVHPTQSVELIWDDRPVRATITVPDDPSLVVTVSVRARDV